MNSIARTNIVRESIVSTVNIAHVTLDIVTDGGRFNVLLTTKRTGTESIGTADTLPEAEQIVTERVEEIRARLQKKRNHQPTALQLKTLFSLKIPIPLTLTFGEASDLIDAALTEKRNERRLKEQKRQEQEQKRQEDARTSKERALEVVRNQPIIVLSEAERQRLQAIIAEKIRRRKEQP